jgi:hypothetical protein
MFDRLKQIFKLRVGAVEGAADSVSPMSEQAQQMSQWAGSHGLAFSQTSEGQGYQLHGHIRNREWRLELGRPGRSFIQGEELRARCDLNLNPEVSVVLMNRPLKNFLEKTAYQIYTDSVQTTASPNLAEELRWIALYKDVGWDDLPRPFWMRYAILTDHREHAQTWVQPALAQVLMNWPSTASTPDIPILLMLMRGKTYLRMQYTPGSVSTLKHATHLFELASELAANGFSKPE